MRPVLSRRSLLLGLAAISTVGGRVALADTPGDQRFVVLLLRGAMDGLAVVAPYGDSAHAGLRAGLALPEPGRDGGLLDLGGFYGLHPALPTVHELFRNNEALWLHAIAGPYRTRSHFDAQDALESGAAQRLREGWLNRAIGALWPEEVSPAAARTPQVRATQVAPMPSLAESPAGQRRVRRGLSVGAQVPLLLRGTAQVSAYAPQTGTALEPDQLDTLSALYAEDPILGPAFREGRAGRGFADDVLSAQHGPEANRPAQRNSVGAVAFGLGQLLADPRGPRVAAFELGGWDTHAFQAGRLAESLRNLDLSIARLRAGLGPVWDRTVVIAMTEFGRTARVNGTHGTDHGTAGAALVLGGAVAGGRVLAEWPGLADDRLFQGRDLAPTADLRAATKALLAGHLGVRRAALDQVVFPGSASIEPMRGLLRA